MSKIFIITRNFPYYPGEQFVEDEAPYWAMANFQTVVVMPVGKLAGVRRTLPPGVELDESLANRSNCILIFFCFLGVFSKFFLVELTYLLKVKKFSLINIFMAIRTLGSVLYIKNRLKRYIKFHGSPNLIYCYWNDVGSYAACRLIKNKNFSVISRAHGSDFYEERRRNAYMPLKRQFAHNYKKILLLSEQALQYFMRRYGVSESQVLVAPLGVPIPRLLSFEKTNNGNTVEVVSVGSCIPLKRIDVIYQALCIVSKKLSDKNVVWTYIGDGPLFSDLYENVIDDAWKFPNLKVKFLRQISNEDVKNYYKYNSVDVFVNASSSEGVPVSIMEAMAWGVPAVAPNIGGISSLVNNDVGCLLEPLPSAEQIAAAVVSLIMNDNSSIRERAYRHVDRLFNSNVNYSNLILFLNEFSKEAF